MYNIFAVLISNAAVHLLCSNSRRPRPLHTCDDWARRVWKLETKRSRPPMGLKKNPPSSSWWVFARGWEGQSEWLVVIARTDLAISIVLGERSVPPAKDFGIIWLSKELLVYTSSSSLSRQGAGRPLCKISRIRIRYYPKSAEDLRITVMVGNILLGLVLNWFRLYKTWFRFDYYFIT